MAEQTKGIRSRLRSTPAYVAPPLCLCGDCLTYIPDSFLTITRLPRFSQIPGPRICGASIDLGSRSSVTDLQIFPAHRKGNSTGGKPDDPSSRCDSFARDGLTSYPSKSPFLRPPTDTHMSAIGPEPSCDPTENMTQTNTNTVLSLCLYVLLHRSVGNVKRVGFAVIGWRKSTTKTNKARTFWTGPRKQGWFRSPWFAVFTRTGHPWS